MNQLGVVLSFLEQPVVGGQKYVGLAHEGTGNVSCIVAGESQFLEFCRSPLDKLATGNFDLSERSYFKIKYERTVDTWLERGFHPFVFGMRQIGVTGVCALKRHEKSVRVTLV